MTSEVIDAQLATEAELAAAKAEAEAQYQRASIQQGQRIDDAAHIPGTVKPMTYRIPEEDQGAWVMVWELKVDANGLEYGIPRRAPRQQLGLWLQKRREFDGGLRFTVDMPPRIAAGPGPRLGGSEPDAARGRHRHERRRAGGAGARRRRRRRSGRDLPLPQGELQAVLRLGAGTADPRGSAQEGGLRCPKHPTAGRRWWRRMPSWRPI